MVGYWIVYHDLLIVLIEETTQTSYTITYRDYRLGSDPDQVSRSVSVSTTLLVLLSEPLFVKPFKKPIKRFPAWRNRFSGFDSWAP
jgi:hypothetical protein